MRGLSTLSIAVPSAPAANAGGTQAAGVRFIHCLSVS